LVVIIVEEGWQGNRHPPGSILLRP